MIDLYSITFFQKTRLKCQRVMVRVECAALDEKQETVVVVGHVL